MKRFIYAALALVVLGYVGVCVALFIYQRSLIYYPQPRHVTALQSTMRLSGVGAELVVSVRPRAGPKAIVYFGGNAEDVSRNLEAFGNWFPEHALYLLHYRGYGGSSGEPTEQANHADAAALFQKVRSEHSDVVVIGRSLGSGVAVRLASEQPASRLVLVTPFNSVEELAAGAYPYLPVKWLLLDRYDSAKYAPGIKVPTTILAAELDDVIPRASTERLLARFGHGVASMKVITGAGHNDLLNTAEYRAALQAAL